MFSRGEARLSGHMEAVGRHLSRGSREVIRGSHAGVCTNLQSAAEGGLEDEVQQLRQ